MNLLLLVTTAIAQEAAAAAPEASHTFSMSGMWTDAGPVAKVVIVMLGVMLVMVVLVAIERMIAFGKATSQSRLLAAEIVPHLQKNDLAAALTVTKNEAYKASYLGALLRAGLVEMNERSDRHGIENAHRAVSKASGQEVSKLRRGMSLLATVGSTAPFVGLFGTTTGVINAFSGMATQGGAGLAGHGAERQGARALGFQQSAGGVHQGPTQVAMVVRAGLDAFSFAHSITIISHLIGVKIS